VVYIVT